MTAHDLHTTDLAGAAQHAANNGHHIGRSPHARAREAGITPADVPTLNGETLDWVAQLPDPLQMVACGVCGGLVTAVDVAGHVVACAGGEVS